MKMAKSPLYLSINKINDPSYKSFVYYMCDKMWGEFYNKRVLIDGKKAKAYDMCYSTLNYWLLFAERMKLSKQDTDKGIILCYLEPAWAGKFFSTKKKDPSWKKVQENMYRHVDWKKGKDEWLHRLWDYLEKFHVTEIAELFRNCYNSRYDDRITLMYRLSFIAGTKDL